jgi:hypothetical protein
LNYGNKKKAVASRLGFVVTEEGVAYNKRKYCRIQRSQRVLQIYF